MFHKKPFRLTKLPSQSGKSRHPNQQAGSALVIAIFVIIVLSVLGAALVKMLDSSQESVAYEVLGTRAYTAAVSGLQWQLAEVFPLNGPAITCKGQTEIDSATPSFNNVLGLAQCNVSVSCIDFERDGIRYYAISGTGTCAIGSELTSRKIAVEAHSLL
ncbi:pilus assembly PilX N-terminal domain-containing protein [Colwellia sp. MB02u-10]|jgi:MSHA biogenesis protein MshP|uniref:pilus assembly PilX N-terminal domain-containing protein n=1 Tax=Colwellia sp. MB02u-10 TaxID=2759828 RepID=UPI0015F44D26|nr:pilus assembly PilX N-terminal domain-containing protein [Colwellia sp. MB02u-10]MBA6342406.1 pilus assembly PilX N-terminal domain-containing protein [Colwellia sp. MB02u-10]